MPREQVGNLLLYNLPGAAMSTKPLKSILKRSQKVPTAKVVDSQKPAPASKKRRKQADEEISEDKQPKSTAMGKKKNKKAQEKAVEKKATQSIPHQAQEESEVSDVGESGKSPQAVGEDNDSDYHLHGFSTDEDSSDEDLNADDEAGVDVGKLPTVSKDDA